MCIFRFGIHCIQCIQQVAGFFLTDSLSNRRRHDPHIGISLCTGSIFVRLICQCVIVRVRTIACGALFPIQHCRSCAVQTFILKQVIRLEPVVRKSSLFQHRGTCTNQNLICFLIGSYIELYCIYVSSLFILHAEICIRDLRSCTGHFSTCILHRSRTAVRECNAFFISQGCGNNAAVHKLASLQSCIPQLEGNLALFCQCFAVNDLFRNVPRNCEVAAHLLFCQISAAANFEVAFAVAPLYAGFGAFCQCFCTNIIVPIAYRLGYAAFAGTALQTSLLLRILCICKALILNVQTAAIHKAVHICTFIVQLDGNAQGLYLCIAGNGCTRNEIEFTISKLVAVQRQTSFTNLRFRFISHTVVLFFECIRSIIFFAAVVTRCQLDVQIIQLQGVQRLDSHSVTVLLYGTDLTVAVCTGVVQTAGVFLALRQSRVNDLDPPRLFTVAGIFRTVYRNGNQFNAGVLCTGGLVFFVNQSGIAVLELELCILIASQLLGYAGRQFYDNGEFLGIRCALDSTLGIRFLKAPPVAVCLGVRCTKVVGEICDHLIRLQIKLQGGDAVTANIRR